MYGNQLGELIFSVGSDRVDKLNNKLLNNIMIMSFIRFQTI